MELEWHQPQQDSEKIPKSLRCIKFNGTQKRVSWVSLSLPQCVVETVPITYNNNIYIPCYQQAKNFGKKEQNFLCYTANNTTVATNFNDCTFVEFPTKSIYKFTKEFFKKPELSSQPCYILTRTKTTTFKVKKQEVKKYGLRCHMENTKAYLHFAESYLRNNSVLMDEFVSKLKYLNTVVALSKKTVFPQNIAHGSKKMVLEGMERIISVSFDCTCYHMNCHVLTIKCGILVSIWFKSHKKYFFLEIITSTRQCYRLPHNGAKINVKFVLTTDDQGKENFKN